MTGTVSTFDPTTAKGLTVGLLRGQYRSDRSRFADVDEVTLVAVVDRRGAIFASAQPKPLPEGSQVFEPTPERPAAILVVRQVGGRKLYHVEPLEPATGVGYMAGGSYAATSDSRFGALTDIYGALSVHDYSESREQYASHD